MVRRLIAALLIAVLAFGWGVTTGLHRSFPWDFYAPLQARISAFLWMTGMVPVPEAMRPEPEPEPEPAPPQRMVFKLDSALLNFDGVLVNNSTPIEGTSGAMAMVAGGVLVARPDDGAVWLYDRASDAMQKTALLLPPTLAETMPARTSTGRDIPRDRMRYHDIEVATRPDGQHLLVSLTRFNKDATCFELELHEAPLPADLAQGAGLDWRRLFASTPCLTFSDDRNVISGNQAGGRIVVAPNGGIYLSTGDFEFDGIDSKVPAVSQLTGSTLGRVMQIGWDGSAVELSRGHRNPQGLALLGDQLWETEHGPMGGDELNRIVPGSDYGWPSVTLGVTYTDSDSDAKFWPHSSLPGRHDGFTPPVLAWLPSVAPSALIAVAGLDKRWDGDLLVATLAGQALHRLRLDGGHVQSDERIEIGARIRDIGIADGRLYLLLDDGRFGYLTPHMMADSGDVATVAPKALTQNSCVTCHSNPALPRLAGLLGADIASQDDIAYSDALKAVEGVWTPETLRAFLASPQEFAPGATMPNPELSPEVLEAVVDELGQLKS